MQQFRSIFVLFTLFCYLSNNKNGGCQPTASEICQSHLAASPNYYLTTIFLVTTLPMSVTALTI